MYFIENRFVGQLFVTVTSGIFSSIQKPGLYSAKVDSRLTFLSRNALLDEDNLPFPLVRESVLTVSSLSGIVANLLWQRKVILKKS